jgi:cytochrome o ubiquinol oxidase subunit 1
MLGKLNWSVIPFYQPLPLYAMGVVGLVILAVLAIITKKG